MKTILTLVRHGETEWNALRKIQGSNDIELSKDGIIQAQYLKIRLENNFDYIYTSPLKRAIQTAEIISESRNIKPTIESEIREINFGAWEGQTFIEVEANYPKEFATWRNDEVNGPMCGGDLSLKNACIRAERALLKIVKNHQGSNIIIVAHGGIIKAGLIGIFDWKINMYHKMALGNTAICKISFDDDLKPTIITLNDTNHLPNDYAIKSFI